MKKIKIILIVIGIIVGLLIVGVITYFIFSAVFARKCEPLTPLALEKFKTASGVKPVEGEKCQVSSKSYLLNIEYDSDSEAEQAKTGLQIITEGKRKEINGLDWISNKGDSSVFWTKRDNLIILVAPDIDEKDKLEKELDKAESLLKG